MSGRTAISEHMQARRASAQDQALLERWYGYPGIQDALEDVAMSPEGIRRKAAHLTSCDPFRDGECVFILEVASQPVAMIHYARMNWISRVAEVIFMLSPEAPCPPWRGAILLDWTGRIAFTDFNLHKIYAFVYQRNLRSFRLLTRFMRTEVTLKGYLRRAQAYEDAYIVALTAAEYHAIHLRYRTLNVGHARRKR